MYHFDWSLETEVVRIVVISCACWYLFSYEGQGRQLFPNAFAL